MTKKKEVTNVTYLTSLALAVPFDDGFRHVQLTLVRVDGTEEIRCYMDVLDPTKLPKFQESVKDEAEVP